MAKAGASYGLALLWTLLVSCAITYFMIVTYGHFTLVTGETALHAFRKHIHPAVGIFFIAALTTAVCGSVMGVMGIVADVCAEWSKGVVSGGIAPLYFALFFVALIYMLFWRGTTRFFQKALAVMVALMAASFILNFFILTPSSRQIVSGLVPSLPVVPGDENGGPFLVIASMVGTTVFSGLFIIRTTLVKEAGWTLRDLNLQRRDGLASAAMMFVISAAVMAAAAGTLHTRGLGLSEASQMVDLIEPFAGRTGVSILVLGIVAAGLSSQFPNVLMLPWMLCDYRQLPRQMTLPRYRAMVLAISLLGLVVPVFDASPVAVMIASQAFTAVILPATVLSILYLGNLRRVMGKHTHSLFTNVVLVAILLFALCTSWIGVGSLLQQLF